MMKNKSFLAPVAVILFLLAGCHPLSEPANPSGQNPPVRQPAYNGMTEAEAKLIAEKTCIKGGETLTPGTYNENSRTWWFDANLNAVKEGCNPACVVQEDTKTADINWRCTGLAVPMEPVDEAALEAKEAVWQIFVDKYPKYAKTLSVKITHSEESHVRGAVTFEEGAPGGIFFALKIDGAWNVIHEGNGQIPCSLANQDFPSAMLQDCAQ